MIAASSLTKFVKCRLYDSWKRFQLLNDYCSYPGVSNSTSAQTSLSGKGLAGGYTSALRWVLRIPCSAEDLTYKMTQTPLCLVNVSVRLAAGVILIETCHDALV